MLAFCAKMLNQKEKVVINQKPTGICLLFGQTNYTQQNYHLHGFEYTKNIVQNIPDFTTILWFINFEISINLLKLHLLMILLFY